MKTIVQHSVEYVSSILGIQKNIFIIYGLVLGLCCGGLIVMLFFKGFSLGVCGLLGSILGGGLVYIFYRHLRGIRERSLVEQVQEEVAERSSFRTVTAVQVHQVVNTHDAEKMGVINYSRFASVLLWPGIVHKFFETKEKIRKDIQQLPVDRAILHPSVPKVFRKNMDKYFELFIEAQLHARDLRQDIDMLNLRAIEQVYGSRLASQQLHLEKEKLRLKHCKEGDSDSTQLSSLTEESLNISNNFLYSTNKTMELRKNYLLFTDCSARKECLKLTERKLYLDASEIDVMDNVDFILLSEAYEKVLDGGGIFSNTVALTLQDKTVVDEQSVFLGHAERYYFVSENYFLHMRIEPMPYYAIVRKALDTGEYLGVIKQINHMYEELYKDIHQLEGELEGLCIQKHELDISERNTLQALDIIIESNEVSQEISTLRKGE